MRISARAVTVGLTALVMGLAAPGIASASLSIDALTAAPSVPQAGGHGDFSLSMNLSGTDHAKTLVIHLPAGLIGNPAAATPCSEATFAARGCPASGPDSAKVGVSSIAATATSAGIPTDITASGTVFVLQPREGEIARLGIDLYPDGPAALLSPHAILNQSLVSVRTKGDNGLDSTLEGLPKTSQTTLGDADVHLKGLNLTLNGQGAKGPFMSNPTSCNPATTTVDIISYESPDPVSRSTQFTPTDCDKLAFAPKVAITASGTVGHHGRPAMKVAVTQAVGEAAGKRVQLTLPDAVNSELLHTDRKSCSLVQQAAAACPPESLIGSATAETAVLPFPLTGPVYLAASATGLPGLAITLAPLGVTVVGQTSIDSKGRLVNIFDNLPDTPLTNFELNLNGGTGGIIGTTRDLCTGAPGIADGAFVGHNGASTTATATMKVVGCSGATPKAGKPTLSARLHKPGTRRATVTVKVKAGKNAKKLRRVRITLPSGISVRSVKKKVRAVSPRSLKIKRAGRHVIELRTTAKAGVTSMTVKLRAGALKTSRKTRRTIKVKATDIGGRKTNLKRLAARK